MIVYASKHFSNIINVPQKKKRLISLNIGTC